MFLQLPFEGPSVVETRTVETELQLWYANSILVASTPSLQRSSTERRWKTRWKCPYIRGATNPFAPPSRQP